MAHKGTASTKKAASGKPSTKHKPTTTKKASAGSTPARRRKTASSGTQAARKTSQQPARSREVKPVQPPREPMDPQVKTDILLSGILLLCLLLFISNLGIGGRAGKVFSSFFFGLFGILEYIFPVIFFVIALFCIANQGNARRRIKLIGFFFFFIFTCSFVHLITTGYQPEARILDFFSNSAFDHSGGGLFGGLIVFGVGKAFGKVGCFVVSLFGMIITACIMTQRPLVSNARDKGLLAGSRLAALRARTAERKQALPYDDEESYYGGPEDDFYDFPEEKPVRRRNSAAAADADRRRTADTGSDRRRTAAGNGESDRRRTAAASQNERKREGFSDSFIYKLEKMGREAEKSREKESHSFFDPLPEDIYEPAANPIDFYAGEAEQLSIPDTLTEDRDAGLMDGLDEGLKAGRPARKNKKTEETPSYNPYEDLPEEKQEEEDKKKRKKKNSRSSEAEIAIGVENISDEVEEQEKKNQEKEYQLPPLILLKKGSGIPRGDSAKYLKETAAKLEEVLHDFGVNVQVTDVSCGPSVTRYELKPEQGVKVSRIVNLADDIKLNLAASNIRIEAPIPGKAAVGIEVPNKTVASVLLRDLLEAPEFTGHPSKIAFAVGKDIAGKTVVTDIAKMPHLLIAGATGSGKSVCINTLIMSILYKASPDEVKLLMIDPKVVELSVYNGIPHLAIPVVTDPKKAAGALNWAVAEMSDRYNKFAEYGVRDVASYNAKIDGLTGVPEDQIPKKMPQIVIVVDELADLMMVAPGEVEDAICRLAQLARAAGIHLIIATQRPSVNVVTGLIKANMPSRIALSVASGVDSRTILDMNGAEKLLGHGDMLFYPQGYTKPARVQGGYVSDDEISKVVEYLTSTHGEAEYDSAIEARINSSSSGGAGAVRNGSDQDELFIDAASLIIDKDKASIGMLQRAFKIGFNRAARIMDQLCEAGVVGEEEGTKPRKVLMSKEQFENYLEEGRL